MRNTRKSGRTLQSKKYPRPTGKSGRERRTNSNIFRQILAQVTETGDYSFFPPPARAEFPRPPMYPALISLRRFSLALTRSSNKRLLAVIAHSRLWHEREVPMCTGKVG